MPQCGKKNKNISLIRWIENKCVTEVSSYLGAEQHGDVRRYDRKQKEYTNVNRRCVIEEYNQSLGGVDLLDMMCSLYKYLLKSKRWYLYIFYHTSTIALVSGWFLHERDCQELGCSRIMPLKKFQAFVATSLSKARKPLGGRPSNDQKIKKRRASADAKSTHAARFDGVDHFPLNEDKKQRCKNCSNESAFVKCGKCKVHLYLNKDRNCFAAYHGL